MNNKYMDDDLEIPEIDQTPEYRNTRKEQSLETTGADGIPLFLKGEEAKRNYEGDKEITEIEDHANRNVRQPSLHMTEDALEPEKNSSFFPRIAAGLIFLLLTAVLLFAGKTVVDHFVKHPQEAPLEIVPAETAMPSASPQASANAAE